MSLEDQLYPLLDSYNALPRWLQSILGAAYRRLPQSWRYGARYGEFKTLATAGETWSIDEIQNYQLRQLRAVLHHAANHCTYYQRSFLRAGFRDFRLLDVQLATDHLRSLGVIEIARADYLRRLAAAVAVATTL